VLLQETAAQYAANKRICKIIYCIRIEKWYYINLQSKEILEQL